MNLPEFLKLVAGDLVEKVKDGATDIAYEASLDAFIGNYRKFCVSFAKRYLDKKGTDKEILHTFKTKFMKMMQLSAISLDEIDAYVVCRYVDRSGRVLELYMDERKVRRTVKKGAKR